MVLNSQPTNSLAECVSAGIADSTRKKMQERSTQGKSSGSAKGPDEMDVDIFLDDAPSGNPPFTCKINGDQLMQVRTNTTLYTRHGDR